MKTLTTELEEAIKLVLYGDKKHKAGDPLRIEFGQAIELLKDAYEQISK